MKAIVEERRKFPRYPYPPGADITLLDPLSAVVAQGVNLSEGGFCLRLEEALEIRSLVRFQLIPDGRHRKRAWRNPRQPMECTGRVAWVIQRLDLRERPPFLFDTGIEFINPPPLLRRLMVDAKIPAARQVKQEPSTKQLRPTIIRGRCYIPCVTREAKSNTRWHLVVHVDGTPCFSGHYTSERATLTAWLRFKREQARSRRVAAV